MPWKSTVGVIWPNTPSSMFSTACAFCCRHDFSLPSENRTFRGYQLLVQHIAPLEEKLTLLDVSDLGIYIREVSYLSSLSLLKL